MTAPPQGKALDAVALRAQAGDKDALDVLLRGLERLLFDRAVAPVAKRHSLWERQEDLMQMAKIAVMRWLPDFNPATAQATTYLVTNAFWELMRRADKLDPRPVRVPVYARAALRQAPALRVKKEAGEPLTELEEAILKREPQIRAALQRPSSIHPHDGEEGSTDYMLAAKEAEPPVPHEELRALLGLLSKRERFVIDRLYGFHDGRFWTLEEVGRAAPPLHAKASARAGMISRERVRQISERALVKLRRKLGAPLCVVKSKPAGRRCPRTHRRLKLAEPA